MKKLLLTLYVIIHLTSCETQPPDDPNNITLQTGEVLLDINFSENRNLSAPKIVQIEDFGNVSCTPCLTSNKILESLTRNSQYRNQLQLIKFPTNFPSPVDPMYLTAKPYCDYRMSFYQILFAPTIIVDGLLKPVPTDSNQIKDAILQRLQVTSDYRISDSSFTDNNGLFIKLNIEAKNINDSELDKLILRIALIETEIEYTNPPVYNGETKFFFVVRKILPSNEGFRLSDLKGNKLFSFENSLDTNWNYNNLRAVSFIQKEDTKEIIQSCIHN